jgi:transcriptional regulator with XRE-family HTH domain
MDEQRTIGMPQLKYIRKQQRLTLRALADKTGLALKLISKYERGTVDPPSSKLLRIAVALQVPVCALLDHQDDVPTNGHEHAHS